MAFTSPYKVYLIAETTPGVDPGASEVGTEQERVDAALANMTAVPVEDVAIKFDPEFRERAQIGSVGPGQSDPLLRINHGLSGKVSLYPVRIVNADSQSPDYLILRACGLGEPVYAETDDPAPSNEPKTLTYERVKRASTLTLTAYVFHSDDDGVAILTKIHGLQGTGTIAWGPSDELNFTFSMEGTDASEVTVNDPIATYKDSNDEVRDALSGLSARIETLQELDGEVLYEGCMTSGSLDLALDTATLKGIPVGAGGSCPTRSNPGKMSWAVSIEKKGLSEFNPKAYLASGAPLKIIPIFPSSDDAQDQDEFEFYGQVKAVAEGEEDGFSVWQLSGIALWLPVSPSTTPGKTEGSTLRMIQRRLAAA